MPPSVKNGTILVVNYPQMPLSVKTGTMLVANYPQMPLSVKNGDITGSTLSANAAICKEQGQYW